MKKLFVTVVATIFSSCLLVAAPAAPANAGECTWGEVQQVFFCGVIRHYSPDDGLDPAIRVYCDFGATEYKNVFEGESSKKYCPDVDQVYVRDGQEIWCKYFDFTLETAVWRKAKDSSGNYMDATGRYKINNVWDDGYGCTIRAD